MSINRLDVIILQLLKANECSVLTLLPPETEINELQSANALLFISYTLLGISIDVNE